EGNDIALRVKLRYLLGRQGEALPRGRLGCVTSFLNGLRNSHGCSPYRKRLRSIKAVEIDLCRYTHRRFDAVCHVRDRRFVFEQAPIERQPEFFVDARKDTDEAQRGTAAIEEIVRSDDALALQNLLPDRGDAALHPPPGRGPIGFAGKLPGLAEWLVRACGLDVYGHAATPVRSWDQMHLVSVRALSECLCTQ